MTSEDTLTKEQLAARLGFSTRQLDYLVRRQELPAGQRRGRHLYWHEAVAQAWEARVFSEQIAWAERTKQGCGA